MRRRTQAARRVLLAVTCLTMACGGADLGVEHAGAGTASGIAAACGGHVGADGQLDVPGKIEFEYYKAEFRSTADNDTALRCVSDFLVRNPKVKVGVAVFMDNTGNEAASTHISQMRAEAIVGWLVQHGAQPERLSAKGMGPTHPIVPNDTPEHRAMNRRATFHVEEIDQATASAEASASPPQASVAGSPTSIGLVSASPQPTAYAIVIGIEKYSAGLPPPTGARSDAQHMAEVFHTSLGIAPDHMQVILDERATKGAIEGSLAWAKSKTPQGGRVYFYFSGHGSPDAANGASYIVPTDGDPRYLDATAISLHDVLAKLGQTQAREVVAMVDSCFSGAGGRSVLPPGARPLVRVRTEGAPAQIALFSASSANEISGPAPGASGGLFTSYLIEGLGKGAADINGDGQVSLGELSEWVSPRVARAAQRDNRAQNPSLLVGQGLGAPSTVILAWGLPTR